MRGPGDACKHRYTNFIVHVYALASAGDAMERCLGLKMHEDQTCIDEA